MTDRLSTNELAFIGLANEYCYAIESVDGIKQQFVETLLRLLPRIYICANDLIGHETVDAENIPPYLDENTYDLVRQRLMAIMGDDDAYLETMLDDMRYSDTPISSTVSENLADLYQALCDLLHAVRDMDTEVQRALLAMCLEGFGEYWGQTLCNVLRALHMIRYAN